MLTAMKQPRVFVREISNDEVHVGLRDDGIIHINFKPNTEINLEFQSVLLSFIVELVGDKKSLIIYEGGEFISVTKEARENAIVIEEQTPTMASVVVVKNLAQKIIADFYYFVNKPKRPFKVFWDFDKGIEWLHSIEESSQVLNKN